jgi:hypothetical protein
MTEDVVSAYLIDRAGPEANAFGDKLTGREGVELIGGADDIEDALDELAELRPDLILVSTDFGGAGCVSAVESVMALAPTAAVVMLSTRGDRALVQAGMRAGAAGSLDRNASPGETITALHVHKRRRLGENLDLSLAEPGADEPVLRVSGALPVFPASGQQRPEPGVEVVDVTERPGVDAAAPHRVLAPEPPPPPAGPGVAEPVVPSFDEAAGDHMDSLRARLEAPPLAGPRRGFRIFGRRKQQKQQQQQQTKDWGPAALANEESPPRVEPQKESR